MNTGYKEILQGKQRKQQMTWQPGWCVCLSSKLWNRFQPRCVKLQRSSSEAQGTCHYQIIVCSDSRNYTSKSPWKHTCCQNTNHCYPIQLNAKLDCSTEQGPQAEMTQCFSGRLLTGVETKIFFFFFSVFQKHTTGLFQWIIKYWSRCFAAISHCFSISTCCDAARKLWRLYDSVINLTAHKCIVRVSLSGSQI